MRIFGRRVFIQLRLAAFRILLVCIMVLWMIRMGAYPNYPGKNRRAYLYVFIDAPILMMDYVFSRAYRNT